MKLTGVILLAFYLEVSARGNAQQQIAINVKDVSLQKLFAEIEKKASYTFFYDVTTLNGSMSVTVAVKEATVEEILKKAFVGQALEYTIIDRTIFVKKGHKAVAEVARADTIRSGTIEVRGVGSTIDEATVQGMNVTIKQTVIIQFDPENTRWPGDLVIEIFLLFTLVLGSFFLTIYIYGGPLDSMLAGKKTLHRWLGRAGVIVDIMGGLGFIFELFKLLWGK